MKPIRWSNSQFLFFRIGLGGFLSVYFATLIPYGEELFGNGGIQAIIAAHFPGPIFFNPLGSAVAGRLIPFYVAAFSIFSLLFALGVWRKIIAVILWYGLYTLVSRNPMTAHVGLSYLGWLVLATLFIDNDPHDTETCEKTYSVNSVIYWGAWVILGTNYFLGALEKMFNPAWIQGDAIGFLLKYQMGRPWSLNEIFDTDNILLKGITWSVLMVELLFLPLAGFQKTRPVAWCMSVAMHLGIAVFSLLTEISICMLLFHVFLFDRAWIATKIAGAKGQIQK